MKFFSEHEVRKLIEETDIHDGIRGTADEYLPIMKGIELPDKYGRLIDADALKSKIIKQRSLDNPKREKFYNKILDFIFDATTVLEASE